MSKCHFCRIVPIYIAKSIVTYFISQYYKVQILKYQYWIFLSSLIFNLLYLYLSYRKFKFTKYVRKKVLKYLNKVSCWKNSLNSKHSTVRKFFLSSPYLYTPRLCEVLVYSRRRLWDQIVWALSRSLRF